MQKLAEYWAERSGGQKRLIIAAFAATFLAVAGFAWLANRTPMALLYSGLDPAQAGEVMAQLDKSAVRSEIRGDAIWVDAAERDRLRMTLAGMGLPSAGAAGYEILDGMSGFGTTSQMFDAAYWRAKEGELARTILAVPGVKAARVHIAAPATHGYRRDPGGSASVTVTMGSGTLDARQARSLQYLVASGVPGLDPEKVKVIDSARGIISTGEETVAADRAAEMKRNVERILEPHVGAGNAIVELNLDLVTETEQLSEQKVDPNNRALVSQENEETTDQSTNSEKGAVTASSNLPEGTGTSQGDQSKSSSSETRQRQNYEVSKVTRDVVRRPGATRRLTVAVLVNGTAQTAPDGTRTIVPRSEAELGSLRELVASAVGFDEERGDVITVKSLPFEAITDQGTAAEAGGLLSRLALDDLARLALIGIFALAIVFTVMRPVLKARAAAALPPGPGEGAAAAAELLPPMGAPAVAAQSPAASGLALPGLAMSGPDIDLVPPVQPDPVARLRALMRERQGESMRLLSGWIDAKEDA